MEEFEEKHGFKRLAICFLKIAPKDARFKSAEKKPGMLGFQTRWVILLVTLTQQVA